ncbi:MAG: hypothetical protein E7254_07420 [Lachnospiraceae bacterium]|nr:hypothetical protein [Lachnospiraceae bacterium]
MGFVFVIGILQIILLLNFDVNQITDAYIVNDTAKMLAQGITKKISANDTYFSLITNNNLAIIIQMFIYKISSLFFDSYKSNIIIEIIDIICIDLSIFLSYKLVKRFFNARAAVLLLFINMLNPFTYLLILWSYSLVYSLPLTIGIIYVGALIFEEKSFKKNIVYSSIIGVLTVAGFFIRPTVVIPFIALIGLFVVNFKKENLNVKKYGAMTAAFILAFTVSFISAKGLINVYFEETNRAYPLTHYLMMGLSEEGKITPNDVYYTSSFEDTKQMKDANIAQIKNRLSQMSPSDMARHILIKLKTTWSDGSGNIKWYYVPNTKSTELWQWLCGTKNDYVIFYCQGFRIALVFLTLYSLIQQIFRKKDNDFIWLCELVVLGGILFYQLWESKEIYSVPFYMFIHIIVANIVYSFSPEHRSLIKFKVIDLLRAASVGVLIFTLIIGIAQYSGMTKNNYYYYRYSIYTDMNGFFLYKDDVKNLIRKNRTIKQFFYIDEDFNCIDINGAQIRRRRKGKYKLQLFYNDKLIRSQIITTANIHNNIIKFFVPDQTVDHEKKYLLKIVPIRSGTNRKDSIRWIYKKSYVSDQYKGKSYIDTKQVNDLNIRVGNRYQAVYLTWYKYITVLVLLLCLEAYMTYVFWRKVKA